MLDAVGHDVAAVIVCDPDGDLYENQAGGMACTHPTARGRRYGLPHWDEDAAYAAMADVWFYGDESHRFVGVRAIAVLANLIADADEEARLGLRLDPERMATEAWGEAWVPVMTSEGPGFLAWTNSD